MKTFEIDADIRRAQAPPGWVYTDAGVYERLLERVFAGSWQLAADAEAVRVPGQVHPFTLLGGSLNEPLLLVRDRDDRLHCVSNVCTHRGALVCEHPGIVNALRCRYHGRRFALDGRFVSMPEFEQTMEFPSPADDLAPAALALWGPLVFTSLRPAIPFEAWAGAVQARVGHLPMQRAVRVPARERAYLVRANWALYIENYLEGFHIPYVHASLNETLDYGEYRTELHDWSSVQVGVARAGQACFPPLPGGPDAPRPIAGYYCWLFPNTMLNFYPWGISVNLVEPQAVDLTRIVYQAYLWDAASPADAAGAELDRVEREDEAVVEAVQRGVRSRLYGRGRYSPTREQGTHHFHRLLARALEESV